MRLHAVRHAPTCAEGRCVGRTEVEVTLPPEEAARRILTALEGRAVQAVWSSPLGRCRAPAAQVAAVLGVPLRVDARLLEVDFGAWEGRPWEELQAADGERLGAWMRSWRTQAPPGGESVPALEARVRGWLAELPAGDALLVAHAGVVRALRVLCAARAWEEAMAAPVPHLTLESFTPPR